MNICRQGGLLVHCMRMQSWKRKLAALLLMLILPLQGLAASLSPMLCHAAKNDSAATSVADHGEAHNHHGTDTAPAQESSGTSDYAGHLCCHLVFSTVPAMAVNAALPESSVYSSPDPDSPPLFVPERLRRPPRT